MITELKKIEATLKKLVADPDARIGIIVETGNDELGLVATADGYLRLAHALVEFILKARQGNTKTWTRDGLTLPGTATVREIFGLNFIVEVDTLSLASTQAEVQQLVEYYRDDLPLLEDANSLQHVSPPSKEEGEIK